MQCPRCGSENLLKRGIRAGKQRFVCKKCDACFTEGVEYKSSPKLSPVPFKCPHCNSSKVVRDGKLEDGGQRYLCRNCKKGFSDKTFLEKIPYKPKKTSLKRKKEILVKIFSGKSVSQVAKETECSEVTVRAIVAPFYEKEVLTVEQKRLIIAYGYYFNVPIEYIAEYVPCSLRMCKKVLDNFKDKLRNYPKLKKKAMSTILGATLKNLSKIYCNSPV